MCERESDVCVCEREREREMCVRERERKGSGLYGYVKRRREEAAAGDGQVGAALEQLVQHVHLSRTAFS